MNVYGEKQLRMLALAYKDISTDQSIEKDFDGIYPIEESGLTLICIIGIGDQVREEVPFSILKC